MGSVCADVLIVNKRGLHARASAKLVALVAGMEGVEVKVAKDDAEAGGASILALMMLGAAMGDTVRVTVSGDEAEARLAEVTALIPDRFGEDS